MVLLILDINIYLTNIYLLILIYKNPCSIKNEGSLTYGTVHVSPWRQYMRL